MREALDHFQPGRLNQDLEEIKCMGMFLGFKFPSLTLNVERQGWHKGSYESEWAKVDKM